jgi:hypothetical protein
MSFDRSRRWTESELFEWWPVALVAVLALAWLIARPLI